MIADQIGVPAVDLQGIDDVVIIVEQTVAAGRRRNLYIENIDILFVEIGLEMYASGELGKQAAGRVGSGKS